MQLSWSPQGIPHGFLCDTPIHLIYRLAGCLPVGELRRITNDYKAQLDVLRSQKVQNQEVITKVQEEFQQSYDDLLDAQDQSRYILHNPEVAAIVLDSWKFLAQQESCLLHACCVMGNHAHVGLQGFPGADSTGIGQLVRKHKTWTNKLIKAELNLDYDVWALGYFDRYVRAGQLQAVIDYIRMNPVKVGLVARPELWPFTLVA